MTKEPIGAASAMDWFEADRKAKINGFQSAGEMEQNRFLSDPFINSCNNEIIKVMTISPAGLIIDPDFMEVTRPPMFQKIIDEITAEKERYIKENYDLNS